MPTKRKETKMLFVTNRRFQQGTSASLVHGATPTPRRVDFDINDSEPSSSVHFCERTNDATYQEIFSAEFMQRLKASPANRLLLYIHAFNNLPADDIFPRAIVLQELCDGVRPKHIEVVPLIWPCDNDLGILKDYWDDQKAADASAIGFSRVLGKFLSWRDKQADVNDPCYKRINIIAHSMGNRVLRGTLESWARDYGPVQGLFRNIFMVAADVVNETLEKGNGGQFIPSACRNVTVYYASDDLALRSSKVSNLKNKIISRRLGHSGPEDMGKVPNNVYAIDCDDFNNTLDTPAGHTYFLCDDNGNPSPVFNHMMRSMLTGRVDAKESTHTGILERNYDGTGATPIRWTG